MINHIKTSTGFECDVDERIKSDWRLVKLFADINSNDMERQSRACIQLLPFLFADNGEALENHVASLNDGFIPADKIMEEIGEILTSNDDLKK